jgi:hypothetical protein
LEQFVSILIASIPFPDKTSWPLLEWSGAPLMASK